MPRSGGGIYSAPVGTTAVTLTPIESAPYNQLIADLVADANAARPISAGGTGAANAADARTNLGINATNLGASQAEAEAGSDNTKFMTALRTKQAAEGGAFRIAANWRQYRFGGNSAGIPGAIQIGGGLVNEGPDGVVIGNSGHASWPSFIPSKYENSIEFALFNAAATGQARATSGTNTITRLSGAPFDVAWVGKKLYFGNAHYIVATVFGNTLTVTNGFGAGFGTVPFGSTYDEVYRFCIVRGVGTCNIVGNTVTRVEGDPFIPFINGPFKLYINSILRTVTAAPDINTFTLSAAPGNATGASYVFETDINDQTVTLRLQGLAGDSEEAVNIWASGWDGYWLHTTYRGFGQYRKLVMGSGELTPGDLMRQIVMQPNGDMTLMGDYGYPNILLLKGTNVVNWLESSGAATGQSIGWRARGADTNVGMYYDTKGTGAHTFSSGSFGGNDFQIFGIGNSTSWLAAAGSTSAVPAFSAAGAASNIDIGIFPKGTGTLRFGTFTSNADAAVNGYITVKDSAGNVRKLATIA